MKKDYISQIIRFGQNVKVMRESKGLTQQELSGLCDVDIRTIQRVEKGEYAIGLDLFLALLDALEVKADEMLLK